MFISVASTKLYVYSCVYFSSCLFFSINVRNNLSQMSRTIPISYSSAARDFVERPVRLLDRSEGSLNNFWLRSRKHLHSHRYRECLSLVNHADFYRRTSVFATLEQWLESYVHQRGPREGGRQLPGLLGRDGRFRRERRQRHGGRSSSRCPSPRQGAYSGKRRIKRCNEAWTADKNLHWEKRVWYV